MRKKAGVTIGPPAITVPPPVPAALLQFAQRVAGEHSNGQSRLPRSDVLAKQLKFRGLLKWLAPRKGYTFYAGAGENPCSNFLYRPPPIVARIECVAGRVPAAGATQITSLKPYHHPFSGTVDVTSPILLPDWKHSFADQHPCQTAANRAVRPLAGIR